MTTAGIPMDSWRYVLSFGGAAGPGPRMDDAGDESQEDTFADGFVKTYMEYKKDYGFDGIDIDVESSINSAVLRSFRKIYQKLHEKGELISMAPETPSLNPGEYQLFQAGAMNSYAPLTGHRHAPAAPLRTCCHTSGRLTGLVPMLIHMWTRGTTTADR